MATSDSTPKLSMYIYRIVNTANNQCYVGKTNNPRKRMNNHFIQLRLNAHNNKHLQNAYNKYGAQSFIFEVVEGDISDDDIDAKEVFYIQQFDSVKQGYNKKYGGEGRRPIGTRSYSGDIKKGTRRRTVSIKPNIAELQEKVAMLEQQIQEARGQYHFMTGQLEQMQIILDRAYEDRQEAYKEIGRLERQLEMKDEEN